ncbi:ATPase associated with various cellular activities family protein, partial [Chlamydia psittaci 84-8471/1]
MVLRDW